MSKRRHLFVHHAELRYSTTPSPAQSVRGVARSVWHTLPGVEKQKWRGLLERYVSGDDSALEAPAGTDLLDTSGIASVLQPAHRSADPTFFERAFIFVPFPRRPAGNTVLLFTHVPDAPSPDDIGRAAVAGACTRTFGGGGSPRVTRVNQHLWLLRWSSSAQATRAAEARVWLCDIPHPLELPPPQAPRYFCWDASRVYTADADVARVIADAFRPSGVGVGVVLYRQGRRPAADPRGVRQYVVRIGNRLRLSRFYVLLTLSGVRQHVRFHPLDALHDCPVCLGRHVELCWAHATPIALPRPLVRASTSGAAAGGGRV